jgi:hypothetical protein
LAGLNVERHLGGFADVFAHITQVGGATAYSAAIEQAFADACAPYTKGKIAEYISATQALIKQGLIK